MSLGAVSKRNGSNKPPAPFAPSTSPPPVCRRTRSRRWSIRSSLSSPTETRHCVTVIGQWPFTVEEIVKLSQEYQAIIGARRDYAEPWLPLRSAGTTDRQNS